MKRYIVQALVELGLQRLPTSLKPLLKIIKKSVFPHTGSSPGGRTRAYCSISWGDILRWEKTFRTPTRPDIIPLTIFSIAFTTVRRVGSFLPANKKKEPKFAWILPSYVRRATQQTFLIWLPICKSDHTGKGKVLTLKQTHDNCCPFRLLQILLQWSQRDIPIFWHLAFRPTQV